MYDVRLGSLTISYVIDIVTSVVDPSHIIAGTVLLHSSSVYVYA